MSRWCGAGSVSGAGGVRRAGAMVQPAAVPACGRSPPSTQTAGRRHGWAALIGSGSDEPDRAVPTTGCFVYEKDVIGVHLILLDGCVRTLGALL